jgi:uncharacterized protein
MRQLLKASRITGLQISLDGSQENHDRTRFLAGGKPTYDRIVDNVSKTCDEMDIHLRVNVDGVNHGSITDLLDDLERRGLAHKCFIYFAHVDDVNRNSKDYGDRCLTAPQYAKIEAGLMKEALARGFTIGGRNLAQPIGEFCGANSNNYFVIDSNAHLLKCYHDLGSADTEEIGYIDEYGKEVITSSDNLIKWLSWDPFEIDECRTCKVLPLCMGGCSHKIMNHGMNLERGCLKARFTLEDMVSLYADSISSGLSGQLRCSSCIVTSAANV